MARLRSYAEDQLGSRPEVREVTLVGSLARDDWSARSDADLVLIVDSADDRGPLRGARYAPRDPLPVPVDIRVYTPHERLGWSPRFRSEVEHGVVLLRREAPGGA
jgi:predicted nucleotidyltransferase